MIEVGKNVRNLEIVEEKTVEQEEKYSSKLQEMSQRYKEVKGSSIHGLPASL